jgi:hypothetical protein
MPSRLLAGAAALAIILSVSHAWGEEQHAHSRAAGTPPHGAVNAATSECCANMAMKDHATPAPMKQEPCKGISVDCAKEVGCISSPALPAPSLALGTPAVYGHVAYSLLATSRAGLSIKPDLFPPIANRVGA